MSNLKGGNDLPQEYQFLSGGGEMGKLIRTTDWSKTPLGNAENWPPSLRTMVSVLLNNPFGMYIAWGKEYTQIYNDGYRPILGATKHPHALGISTRETFVEVWDIIGSMFDGVMNGVPVGFPDFMLPLDRNGFIENCYFDFAYSPIRKEDGEVGGVLVTVIETTAKKKAIDDLKESEERFNSAVRQAPLGIAIFRGVDFNVERANDAYLLIIDQTADKFIGRPIFDVIPEVKEVVEPLFKKVVTTGIPFYGNEFEVTLKRMGRLEQAYFNFVYHPLKDEEGKISGIMVVAMEVTSTVIAKHLLQESETHFRNMVMQSPIPMTILRGEKFVIESANRAMFESVWRKSEADIIGKPILEVFPELQNQKYPELLKKVFTTGETHSEKESIAYVEGDDGTKKFYLDFEYAPLFELEGNTSGIMITVNDVTDKVAARKNVEEAEERLRLATEATEISIWDLDLRTGDIIYSPRLAKIFGHQPSGIITHAQMRGQIHPDDLHEIVEKAFDEAIISGIYKYEARVVRPDNTICWIRTQGKVFFDEDKKPVKIIGTLRDVTEEKQYQQVLQESESKFRLLADSLPQQIWTADTAGKIFYYNQNVYDYSGLTSEQLLMDGWMKMIHPDDRESNLKSWMESVKTGQDFLFEHRFRRYDGEYRWQLSRALPQKDSAGNIQMWVGSSTDIQEMKEQDQQKDYFISMASHELKTPLTSVKGYVQMLQIKHEKSEDSFLLNSLNIMDKQIRTLTKLINELLDLSKIKSAGLNFYKEHFEITGLINEIVHEVKHINPHYQISLMVKEKAMVYADRDRIGQVLINFLTNAIKYSPQSKTIKVECSIQDDNVIIAVQDFGIGISKKDQEKVFERFYRVEGKNERTFPGFGIGLFIASEIIKRHNGKIWVKSDFGKGSVFSFEIPVS
ncbi:MAG: PAS domain S-box protein [Ginsengibacter sp.]